MAKSKIDGGGEMPVEESLSDPPQSFDADAIERLLDASLTLQGVYRGGLAEYAKPYGPLFRTWLREATSTPIDSVELLSAFIVTVREKIETLTTNTDIKRAKRRPVRDSINRIFDRMRVFLQISFNRDALNEEFKQLGSATTGIEDARSIRGIIFGSRKNITDRARQSEGLPVPVIKDIATLPDSLGQKHNLKEFFAMCREMRLSVPDNVCIAFGLSSE